MLLAERAEGRHQHEQGPAGPSIPAVGAALAQVAGGTGQAPAAALVCQAAQAGGVGGAGRRAVGLQEEEGDLLGATVKTGEYLMPTMGAVKKKFWEFRVWQGSGKYSVIG